MSELPLDYDLNFAASNELQEQTARATFIIRQLAASLAANDASLPLDGRDIVGPEHVRAAAELLFNPTHAAPAARLGHLEIFLSAILIKTVTSSLNSSPNSKRQASPVSRQIEIFVWRRNGPNHCWTPFDSVAFS